MPLLNPVTLDDLRVVYRCCEHGNLNPDFDRAMKALAADYGLEFWASGMELESGKRDLAFDRRVRADDA